MFTIDENSVIVLTWDQLDCLARGEIVEAKGLFIVPATAEVIAVDWPAEAERVKK